MVDYGLLFEQARALTEDESDVVCNLANLSALLFASLESVNWAGFYLVRGEELVLGPFQGKPACRRIRKGKGVCGMAWATEETQLVKDVHLFPGHIACDLSSRSEIVVPLRKDGAVFGVLDVDSPREGNFTEEDRLGLETLCRYVETIV
ncbi:MAG: GAF domain-containing protein [Christensenellaceae bacterium]